MKKSKNNLISLGLLVVMNIAVIAAYSVLFWQIKTKNEKISASQNEIELAAKINAEESSLQNLLQNTKADREKLDAYVLDDDDVVPFIDSIENLANITNSKVTINSVNEEEGTNKKTAILKLEVGVIGSWQRVLQFAELIENMPHRITVKALRLNTVGGEDRSWQANFNLHVVKAKKI